MHFWTLLILLFYSICAIATIIFLYQTPNHLYKYFTGRTLRKPYYFLFGFTFIVFLWFLMGLIDFRILGSFGRGQHEYRKKESVEHINRYDARKNIKSNIFISIPDSLRVFERKRVVVRIAKTAIIDSMYIESIKRIYAFNIIDTAWLTSTVRVDVKESSGEAITKITRINNSDIQVINDKRYNEWIFDVVASQSGITSLVVSISAEYKTNFGYLADDIPLYEKTVSVYAKPTDEIIVIWNRYYWFITIISMIVFFIVYKLIPQQKKIDIYMQNSKETNFWNAGALGIVIYLITIISIPVFKFMDISLFFVPLVFIGTVLIFTVISVISIMDSGKVSEKSFLKLMGLVMSKIPGLGLFFPKLYKQSVDNKKIDSL